MVCARKENPPFTSQYGRTYSVHSQQSGGRESVGAAAPLGILRNRYARGVENGSETLAFAGENGWQETCKKEARQEDRFSLQRTAGTLTPSLRVAHCLWTATGAFVEVLRRGGDARFGGVQTCGSVWGCPCCSARISEVRRQELRALQAWVAARPHLRIVMITLTARHRGRRLVSMIEKMAAAKARMQNRNPWKPLRESGRLVGSVSVREATHGENGWHPHYHVLCIIEVDDDDAAKALLEPVRRVWVECLKLEGLGGTLSRAFHLASGEAVAEYVGKHGSEIEAGSWGIAEEMTLGRLKRGRGEKGASPWQVLREAHVGHHEARVLWQEYALTMHGKRQQVWSNGLKDLIGLREVEDKEAAEGEEFSDDQDELMHQFDRHQWRRWRPQRAAILAAARRGPEAVAELLRGGADDPGEVIEDEAAPVSVPRPAMRAGGLAWRALAGANSRKTFLPNSEGQVADAQAKPEMTLSPLPII
ncbi:protein rep [Bacillus altitudinis]|uniref:protein rep n=1 Tax=Bacillus altitudinis TaxID=293387 RepID=UPI003D036BDC